MSDEQPKNQGDERGGKIIGQEPPQPQAQPVKQVDNKLPPNPTGKGGFQDHPELINKNGRPPKDWSWAELLEDVGEQVEEKTGKKFKELVSQRIWIEAVGGNMLAIKELFNRMEGFPRVKMDVEGKIDTGSVEAADLLLKIYERLHTQPNSDTSDKGDSK